jgi:nitrogen fixation protein NifX
MKIAITTSDGKIIDTHFGHASAFHIYEMENGALKFKEVRHCPPYSISDKTHGGFDAFRFGNVYEIIKDCRFLYTSKIGEIPEAKLKEKGILTEVVSAEINKVF